ncbi:MAG: GAF domain-containing sensor histidine kinase [Proteobacteria bacterium]|nr:GAF domain-containing sensor histidine kinase [Pseudomonadota bacterium]
MNPSATLRFRRTTSFLSAGWASLAMVLSIVGVLRAGGSPGLAVNYAFVAGVATVQWATPEAAAAGAQRGHQVLSIDGVPVDEVVRRGGPGLVEGVPNAYRLRQDDGRVITVSAPPTPPGLLARPVFLALQIGLLLVAGLYLGMGASVWWNRPDRTDSWVFLLFCSTMCVQLATMLQIDVIPWASARAVANLPLLGATTVHLFTTYPVEPNWVVRHRRIQWVPYIGAAAFILAGLLEPWLPIARGTVTPWAFFYGMGLSAASLIILAFERRRAREAGMGDRADVMFLAGLISFLPAILVLLAERFLATAFPVYLAMLWMAFFPVAVGLGMLRKSVFEFRIVAKSSAAYGAATLAITGIYAFLISFADAVVSTRSRTFQAALLFVAILAFNPLRNRLQGLVDRIFDRDRSRYRQAVREISEAMVSMLSMREIGDRILVALTDTMGVERAMVLLFDEHDRLLRPSAWRGDWDEEDIEVEIPSEHPIWKHLWMRREELSRVDFDDEIDPENREACRDVFDTLEVELLVPILFGVDLLGVIAVGRKLSGERLAADDRQLLRTLANQSSIAIENAKAFDEIAKLNETLEARVEERTRELRDTQDQLMQGEKMKSLGQLVAGVAHELNNPIGFVHANLQLLEEYIPKLVAGQDQDARREKVMDAISKLLTRSREGTERVKQIVQDLRTFSRMDQAELQDADLHEEIDRTLTLMAPRFKGGIEVAKRYGTLPRVRCYPGQLNQVFLNLLMNACDAMADEGTLTISTQTRPGGVRLEFRDDGPGIPPEIQSRLFDPFFTTKPVGKGTGLGLSLSHGIIERHGGRIFVSSQPGQGAVFTIDLPLDAAPAHD